MPRPIRYQHWAIFVTLAALLAISLRGVWRPLAAADVQLIADEDLNNLQAAPNRQVIVSGSALLVEDGIAIVREAHAEVRLIFPERQDGLRANALRVWMSRAGGSSNRIECSTDSGRTFTPVAEEVNGAGARLALPQCVTTGALMLRIRLDGSNIGDASAHLAIDKVQLLAVSGISTAPDLVQLTTGWILLAIVIVGASRLTRGITLSIVAGAITLGLVTVAHYLRPESFTPQTSTRYVSVVSAAGLAILASNAAWQWFRDRAIESSTHALAVAFVMTLAFQGRWSALVSSLEEPPSPDVATVLGLIRGMTGPYDTAVREPLWLWGVRAAEWAWGDNGLAARMFSLICSLLLVGLTYLFARTYLRHRMAALIALCVVGLSPTLVDSSIAGHRTELYGAALLIVALSALSNGWKPLARTCGLVSGVSLTVLTQSAGVLPAFAAALWCCVRGRIRLRQFALVAVIATAVILPHALDNQRHYGQAFYFARTAVPTFYRNYEFMMRGGPGCDGCPTPEQLRRSSYSGRPATMFEYLFRLHTLREVVGRTALGYVQVFLLPTSHSAAILGSSSRLLFIVYLVGFVVAVATPAREVLLIPLLSVNLLAFIVPIGLDERLLLHIAPFAAVLVGLAARTAATRAGIGPDDGAPIANSST